MEAGGRTGPEGMQGDAAALLLTVPSGGSRRPGSGGRCALPETATADKPVPVITGSQN